MKNHDQRGRTTINGAEPDGVIKGSERIPSFPQPIMETTITHVAHLSDPAALLSLKYHLAGIGLGFLISLSM